MKELKFNDLIIILSFLCTFIGLGVYIFTGNDLKFLGKFGIMFLCLNLMISQLKGK